MSAERAIIQEDFRRAYLDEESEVRVRTGRLACALVFFLMPLGAIIDYLYYGEGHFTPLVKQLLLLRLVCSLLIIGVWKLHHSRVARTFYPLVGMPIVILPAAFMCLIMLKSGDGAFSSYYAALNLILLAVSTVGRWSVGETLCAVGSVMGLYFLTYLATETEAAKGLPQSIEPRALYTTHLYFILLTGLIAICGNYVFNKVRFSEFKARWALKAKQTELESANLELESVNEQLKQKQAQLVQQEKMASLGKMSAGIAHEINNPLNFVKMNLFTLRKKNTFLPPDHQAKYLQLVDSVEDGVNRVKTIVSDLRTFSHPDEISRDDVSVAEVVASVLRFLSTDLKDSVEVIQDLEPELTLWANQNKMIQVLLNLVQNSVDALKAKSFPNGERPTICISSRRDGDRTIITVRDNGPGIPLEHRAKIYDPFFTTKDIGQGMGLGLSICYGIVQEFQGTISVKTETGQYCEFSLSFPAHAEPTART